MPSPGPIASGLLEESSLRHSLKPGIQAVRRNDRSAIGQAIRGEFRDSLDLDRALSPEHADAPRWDYLLGHSHRGIVALEVHPATDGEVERVIGKKRAARDQLDPHLADDARIERWYWAASGRAALWSMKAKARLASEGVEFVGRCLLRKHL